MRAFRPKALERHAGPELRPRMQSGETVHRFTVTIPLQEISPNNTVKMGPRDLQKLEKMLAQHFRLHFPATRHRLRPS